MDADGEIYIEELNPIGAVMDKLIQQAKEKYPVSIQYKGRLTMEELEELEKYCDVHAFSVYMNGTVVYSIRYRKEQI